jgi:hypothetical protein
MTSVDPKNPSSMSAESVAAKIREDKRTGRNSEERDASTERRVI